MTQHGGPEHPEIPYPFPPYREPPQRTEPVIVPTVGIAGGDIAQSLFQRRTVFVSGPLDRQAATNLCAQLMALDGESDRHVDMIVNSEGGPLTEVSAILDVLELMRAPVQITCVGTAKGTAGIVLACGTAQRRAAPNATISLCCNQHESVEGTAADIARYAQEIQGLRHRLVQALAVATGQPVHTIATELDHGGMYDAAAAQSLGLIDDIAHPKSRR